MNKIAFYHFRKQENLLTPMITGDKSLAFPAHHARDGWPERRRAALIFLVCVAAVSGAVSALNA